MSTLTYYDYLQAQKKKKKAHEARLAAAPSLGVAQGDPSLVARPGRRRSTQPPSAVPGCGRGPQSQAAGE